MMEDTAQFSIPWGGASDLHLSKTFSSGASGAQV